MQRTQRGVTFIGWLLLLTPVAIVVYVTIRLVPVYLNYNNVARGMNLVSQESRPTDSAQAVRFALEKQLDVDAVTFPTSKDFVIRRDGPSWLLEIEYEDGSPLIANVSVVVKFNKSVRLGQAPE